MANFTKYKTTNTNKTLKTPKLHCIDLDSHLGDAVLMTSLHDVMSTRVDNSGLPEVDYSCQ